MVNRLAKKIKFFKQELLNLKTAHDRGLGTAVFFYNPVVWSPITPAQHVIRITAVFKNPEAVGMTQMGLPTEPGFVFGALLNLNAYPGGAFIDLSAQCDADAEFVIISSEGISSLTITELS